MCVPLSSCLGLGWVGWRKEGMHQITATCLPRPVRRPQINYVASTRTHITGTTQMMMLAGCRSSAGSSSHLILRRAGATSPSILHPHSNSTATTAMASALGSRRHISDKLFIRSTWTYVGRGRVCGCWWDAMTRRYCLETWETSEIPLVQSSHSCPCLHHHRIPPRLLPLLRPYSRRCVLLSSSPSSFSL